MSETRGLITFNFHSIRVQRALAWRQLGNWIHL